jgi:hypothetical protein
MSPARRDSNPNLLVRCRMDQSAGRPADYLRHLRPRVEIISGNPHTTLNTPPLPDRSAIVRGQPRCPPRQPTPCDHDSPCRSVRPVRQRPRLYFGSGAHREHTTVHYGHGNGSDPTRNARSEPWSIVRRQGLEPRTRGLRVRCYLCYLVPLVLASPNTGRFVPLDGGTTCHLIPSVLPGLWRPSTHRAPTDRHG